MHHFFLSILLVVQLLPFASSLIHRPFLPSVFNASAKSRLNRARRHLALAPIVTTSRSHLQNIFINKNRDVFCNRVTEIPKRMTSTLFSFSFDTDEKTKESEDLTAEEVHKEESGTEMAGNTGSKTLLAGMASAYLLSVSLLAKLNFLGPYTDALIARDAGVTILCTVLAVAFVKAITFLASKEVLEPRDSRKIIHTCSAPLYMLLWPLFSDLPGGKLFAAFVPVLNASRLWLAGTKRGGKFISKATQVELSLNIICIWFR